MKAEDFAKTIKNREDESDGWGVVA